MQRMNWSSDAPHSILRAPWRVTICKWWEMGSQTALGKVWGM